VAVVRTDRTACPYCPSLVEVTTHDDGRLEVHHLDEFGPDCEAGLRRAMADEARQAGLRLMLRN
jgi:hypothetical protein